MANPGLEVPAFLFPDGWERGLGGAAAPGSRGESGACSPGGPRRTEPAPSATSPRTPPPYSWTTLRLRPGLRPPKHPMSAGEPLDTSVGIDVFIRPTQTSALTLLQRVESHPRPAPQEFSLCPKFACWSKGRWPCSFRAGETRLLGSKREKRLSSRSPSPPPPLLARGLSHG